MEDMVKMTAVYDEVKRIKGWDKPESEKDYSDTLRKRYRQIVENILYRDMIKYKDDRPGFTQNFVPASDAPVIREILLRSTRGKYHDSLISQWVNGSLKGDYLKIVNLYQKLIDLLKNLMAKGEISPQREYAWVECFNSNLGGDSAILIKLITVKLSRWLEHTTLLSHNLCSDKFQEMLENDDPDYKQYRVFSEYGDLTTEPLPILLQRIQHQDEYIYLLYDIIDEMEKTALIQCEEKICQVIIENNGVKFDLNAFHTLQPNGKLIFAKEAYKFLKTHPESRDRLNSRLSVDPLMYFKLIPDEEKEYNREEATKAFIDYLFSLET